MKVLILSLFLLVWIPVSSFGMWNPSWEVAFTDILDDGGDSYTDFYSVGGGGSAGYVLAEDVLKVHPPGWPDGSYSGYSVPYLSMSSTAGGRELLKDARDVSSATWDIDKKFVGGSSNGTEVISWTLASVPGGLNLQLIDYGQDSSRIAVVQIVDMQVQSSYIIGLSGASGTYRYLSVLAGAGLFEVVIDKDASGDPRITWESSGSKSYAIYYTDDLLAGWTVVPGKGNIPGTGSTMQWVDDGSDITSPPVSDVGKRFYKVEEF